MILPVYDAKSKQFFIELHGNPEWRERLPATQFFALARAVDKARESFMRHEMSLPGGALLEETQAESVRMQAGE